MAGVGVRVSKSKWIQFFKDAGIPSEVAAKYALTFFDNRIQTDMLLDLHKEYLHDMGITILGDVIAILRHAKRVYEQNEREKNISDSTTVDKKSPTLPPESSGGSSSSSSSRTSSPLPVETPSPKRATAALRMLEHYMRKSDEESPPHMKLVDRLVLPSDDKLVPDITPVQGPSVKRKLIKRKIVATENDIQSSAKKACSVLHDGRYKITVPMGSTQRILEKQGHLHRKKTVFDRLGEGSVTSTTEVAGPRITITGLGTTLVKKSRDKQSSVFSRLGNRPQVSSSTAPDDHRENSYVPKNPLPYAGILKPSAKKVIKKRVATSTMRADVEEHGDSFEVFRKLPLQGRLGVGTTLKEARNKTAGILANPTNAQKQSVKSRLGDSATDEPLPTVKRPVFKSVVKKTSTPLKTFPSRSILRQDMELQRGSAGVFSRLGF